MQTMAAIFSMRSGTCYDHHITYETPLVRLAGSPIPFPPVGHSTSWRAKARHPRLYRMQPGKGVDGGPSPAMTEFGPQARPGTGSPLPARRTSAKAGGGVGIWW